MNTQPALNRYIFQRKHLLRLARLSLPIPLTFLLFWDDKHSDHSLWMFPCGWWTQTARTLFSKYKWEHKSVIASSAIRTWRKVFSILIPEDHLSTPNSDTASLNAVSVKTAAYAWFNYCWNSLSNIKTIQVEPTYVSAHTQQGCDHSSGKGKQQIYSQFPESTTEVLDKLTLHANVQMWSKIPSKSNKKNRSSKFQ